MSGTPPVQHAEEQRRPRTCLAVVGVGLLLVLVISPFLFVSPASDDPAVIRTAGPVDAVVVLGGSPEVRLPAATDVVAQLDAPRPTVVLAVQYEAPVVRCGELPELVDVPLTCFSPSPATTSGEALWIAEEAAARGWDRVVVATSEVHVTRARVLVQRCVEALTPETEVLYLAADTPALSLRGVWSILTETASLLGTPWDHRPACR